MQSKIEANVANSLPVTYIDIAIQEDGTIIMINDGNGIDVVQHPEYNTWVPELIFGHLRTSTNYNKEEKKIVGGKNGFGFKLVLIWSTYGSIETVDHIRGLKYTQEFKNNLDTICPPKITKAPKAKPYTKISFKPDYQKLGLNGLTSDMIYLLKKRNIMHEKTTGEIIIYMDDDDYYPPERISHAVETLQNNPQALCAGSSEMYIYFKHIQKMYQFGPYKENHSTAATFAFRRELLKHTSYDDNACLAEEKHFLKNYTIPFVQLDPLKSILVFSHNHNSFDKKILLDGPPNKYVKVSDKKVTDFIKEPTILNFFMVDIDELLESYEPGNPKHKPDVFNQMKEIQEKRNKIIEEQKKQQNDNLKMN
jgi:hypothetical protein